LQPPAPPAANPGLALEHAGDFPLSVQYAHYDVSQVSQLHGSGFSNPENPFLHNAAGLKKNLSLEKVAGSNF